MTQKERILIQLTKAERLLKEEGFNDKTLNPMRNLINELRSEMNVQRVKTCTEEVVIYKAKANVPDLLRLLNKVLRLKGKEPIVTANLAIFTETEQAIAKAEGAL